MNSSLQCTDGLPALRVLGLNSRYLLLQRVYDFILLGELELQFSNLLVLEDALYRLSVL